MLFINGESSKRSLHYISIVLDCPGKLSRTSAIIWKTIKGGVSKNNEGDMVCDVSSPFSNRNLKGLANVK